MIKGAIPTLSCYEVYGLIVWGQALPCVYLTTLQSWCRGILRPILIPRRLSKTLWRWCTYRSFKIHLCTISWTPPVYTRFLYKTLYNAVYTVVELLSHLTHHRSIFYCVPVRQTAHTLYIACVLCSATLSSHQTLAYVLYDAALSWYFIHPTQYL